DSFRGCAARAPGVSMSSSSSIRRDVGPFALMLTGLGSIIGSGWLFGAWRAAQIAGPGAIWAWVIGAVIILFIALTYAELGAMFPESGGMVRYGHYSHGSLVGFIAAWANWIAIVSVISVEAEASAQYMSSWKWAWAKDLYHQAPGGHGELSTAGLAIAAVLVIAYFLLNFWSVKLFARSNTAITLFKLVIPALTAVLLIASGFHPENFSVGIHGEVHAIDFASVLTAVAIAGIVFSFNDAVISPSGTGMTYTATTARMLYGMERNGTLPKILGRVHPKWGVPRPAMWVNLGVSFLFLFFFRGWGSLAAVISVATIISYLTGPVSVMTLRRTAPGLHRPFRLAGLPILAGIAFIMSTELLYWAKWPLTGEIILLMVVALPVYFYYQAKAGWHDFGRQMK